MPLPRKQIQDCKTPVQEVLWIPSWQHGIYLSHYRQYLWLLDFYNYRPFLHEERFLILSVLKFPHWPSQYLQSSPQIPKQKDLHVQSLEKQEHPTSLVSEVWKIML